MSNYSIKTGNILRDTATGIRYRVIAMIGESIALCEMDTSQLKIIRYDLQAALSMLASEDFEEQTDTAVLFDLNDLPKKERKAFKHKRNMMRDVEQAFGPDYLRLSGRKKKPEVEEILQKYNVPRNTFWRICTKYFQSGMRDVSLVNERAVCSSPKKTYDYKKKPGRKPEALPNQGVIIDKQTRDNFEEARQEYLSGRAATYRSAYDNMNIRHYSVVSKSGDASTLDLLPPEERPTYGQFAYYMRTHLDSKQKETAKTSAQEYHNKSRLLLGSDSCNVCGDLVEIDICEMDVSLVSQTDKEQVVSRPDVYAMVDVMSRCILAISPAFDNNSVMGITNLFLNLGDDKQEYCKRYGVTFDNPDLWPSNIIPARVRMDRGSDMVSKELERICTSLGIAKELVPPGHGSLKGLVEQSFHQMHSQMNPHLEGSGLIEKRHDSKHHEEAVLDIADYRKLMINFVLYHNQQYMKNYRLTKDMQEKKVLPVPAKLWEYSCNKYGTPKPIPVPEQYLYELMTPIKAKINRDGINYKGLIYYTPTDPQLNRDMGEAQNSMVPFECRIDMRCIDAVYYIRNGKLVRAPLKEKIPGNAEYGLLTMSEWDKIRKDKSIQDRLGEVHNENLSAAAGANCDAIVEGAKARRAASNIIKNDTKNIREAREAEKHAVESEERMETRLLSAAKDAVPNQERKKLQKSVPDDLDDEIDEDWRKAANAAFEKKYKEANSADNDGNDDDD